MSLESLIELPIIKQAITGAVADGRTWGQAFLNDSNWQGDRDRMAEHAIYESTLWSLGNGIGNSILGFVGIPSDLAVTLYSQVKLSSALFAIYAVESTNKSIPLVLAVAAGVSMAELANYLGVNVAKHTVEKALMAVPSKVFIDINRAIGIKLISRTSEKTLLNVAKILPIFSSVASGTVNAVMMNACGHSILTFIKNWKNEVES